MTLGIIRARGLDGIQPDHRELSLVIGVVKRKAPRNFLVFGLDNDSVLWSRVNRGGNTVGWPATAATRSSTTATAKSNARTANASSNPTTVNAGVGLFRHYRVARARP